LITKAQKLDIGFFPNVPMETYRQWPEMNASTLIWGMVSEKHLKASLDGRMDHDSPAMAFGRAYHAALLEPEVFKNEYREAQNCQVLMKSGKRAGEACGAAGKTLMGDDVWACGKHNEGSDPDENALASHEFAAIRSMRSEVMAHDVVKLLRQAGGFEISARARFMNVDVKIRLDKYIPLVDGLDSSYIIDLKKTRRGKVTSSKWEAEVLNYHYHVKASWYRDIAAELTGDMPRFIWIAQEDEAPYDVGVYEQDQESYEIGRWEYRNLVAKFINCTASGNWPGVCQDIVDSGLPEWHVKQMRRIML